MNSQKFQQINPTILQEYTIQYLLSLKSFFQQNNLLELFSQPVDHLAYKTADITHYEKTIQAILPFCTELSYTWINNRRLATAILKKPIDFSALGKTQYLEIMEPRPEKVGKDLVGFEHIELYRPDQINVEKVLKEQHTSYTSYTNPYHTSLVLKINEQGQEVKFTNTPLKDSIVAEAKDRKVIYLEGD